MCNLKVLSLLLLGSCGVLFVFAEPVPSEETTIKNDAGVTLSTELQPPPLPPVGEHRGIVYLINLFAVKNKTGDDSEGKSENALTDDSPEVVGPLASILLFVNDDDDDDDDDDVGNDEVTLDDLTKISVEEDYAEGVSPTENVEESKEDSSIPEKSNVAVEKSKNPEKTRKKRTLPLKHCKVCGGNGGGGGYGRDYDNYYPSGGSGGRNVGVIPIVLAIPVERREGGRRGHRNGNYGGRRGDDYYSNNGGGQGYGYHYDNGGYSNSGGNRDVHYPSNNNGYPYGGGNYYPAGGSNAQSQASAQASGSGQGYGQAQSQAQAQAQASSGR